MRRSLTALIRPQQLHRLNAPATAIDGGAADDLFSANSRISQLARMGRLEQARKMFDEMLDRNSISWNAIVAAYFQSGRPEEARRLFDAMPPPLRNTASWNGMVSGYVKTRQLHEASAFFDAMPERNVVSWTAMLRGHVEHGSVGEAEALFRRMPARNVVSYTVMLGGLLREGRVEEARHLFDEMPHKDVVARTSMVAGYCQAGRLSEARALFDEMPKRNVVSWTTMMVGYAQNGHVDIARKLFEVMPERNEVTWTAMLSGYLHAGRSETALELFHAMLENPPPPVATCNAMILGLGQNGEVAAAEELFQSMAEKDEGSWSGMIKVYERNGLETEALRAFSAMQAAGQRPNFASLVSVLAVCAALATLRHGRQVHAAVLKSHFDGDLFVVSALITMYVRCGDLGNSKKVFSIFPAKDTAMWNAMITGHAQHGLAWEALAVFSDMRCAGVAPTTYGGKVEEGRSFFRSMAKVYSVEPKTEHYACMVDMLGRAGLIEEAVETIQKMPMEPDAVVWGSLLGACRTHKNLAVAEKAARELRKLEPGGAGHYVLLCNIYAAGARWGEVAELRQAMRARKVSKSPGCSWIEVEGKVHVFTGDGGAAVAAMRSTERSPPCWSDWEGGSGRRGTSPTGASCSTTWTRSRRSRAWGTIARSSRWPTG
ncbi:unnamed protein product [Spirodela intermedia]|uniref:Uncharacterized protein n=1 Tax=Spirodela intermedia TaxID=51605 RepID=A0A7I8J0A3_SPIIN|nr:unnamed protein product [Spirodela intermedia]CAA6663645.1 unnamed protein product [Spirodela intermedia]